MGTGDDRDAPDGAGVRVLSAVFAAVSIAAANVANGVPRTGLAWAALVAQALAAAVLAPGLAALLLQRWGTAWARLRGRARLVLFWVLVSALAAGVGLVAPGAVAAVWGRVRACPHPVEVRVLTSPEILEPSREIADEYERWTAARNYDCPAANLFVYATPPGRARAGMKVGWSAEYLRGVGPRPDVWLPGSAVEVAELAAFAKDPGAPVTVVENHSVASSPIVLGLARSAAVEPLLEQRTEAPWSRLWARLRDLGWGLVRPDPASSLVGRLGTVALYTSVGGGAKVADAVRTRAIEQQIGQSLDHGGYPLGETASLLCRHRDHAGAPTALVVSEQALIRYNQGRSLGGSCSATRVPDRAQSLVALYPSDTLSLDHPFVRLGWPAAGGQSSGAAEFGRWLASAAGKRALLRAGLRPPGTVPSEPVSESFGALPGAVFARRPPPVGLIRGADRAYAAAHRPGRVLLALDASGSMRERAALEAHSRFSVASHGVEAALGAMGGEDEFGLWIFPGGKPGQVVQPLAALGRDGPARSRRASAVGALRRVRPDGSTPLFDTISAGVASLGPPSPDRVTALVVLTDGEDNASRVSGTQLIQTVRAKEVRVFVIAVGEARCSAQTLVQVTSGTGGACYVATFDSLASRLAELFGALWAGPGSDG